MERSGSPVVYFSELAAVFLDEVLDPTSQAGIARSLELEKAGDRGEKCTDCIHDQVPHRIDES